MAKYRWLGILLILYASFLIQCVNSQIKINSDTINNNRKLIPFVDFDSKKERKWGYLDEETGEIVIPAKYAIASPYVGNYAVISKDWHSQKLLIDKNGKEIFVGEFDEAYFITSENNESTAVILANQHRRSRLHIDLGILGSSSEGPRFDKEEYNIFRMINPATGKTIIPRKENYLIYHIETVGEYFIAGTDLYQFMNNGDIECVAKNNIELAVNILRNYFETRHINAHIKPGYTSIDIDYAPYIKKKFANPDLSGAVLRSEFVIPFYKAEPLFRDPRDLLNAPLEITERKYLLHYRNEKTGQHAVGIYNESKTEWEMRPYFIAEETGEWYFITKIIQTNNPQIYLFHLNNDTVGWSDYEYAIVAGGLFNTAKNEFMFNFYLYEDYPPRLNILKLGALLDAERAVKFPDYGVYYRDYGRIKKIDSKTFG